ncbi:unnamed protein product [Trichogramma brassicae]|uniref:Uncharacterized protein n=1 Tax=Trichogramma brassicae TaxID=86971 RepID=A0A6H5I3A4_9HYME|nr:unnamed protein product [Trichogramma brassicae]
MDLAQTFSGNSGQLENMPYYVRSGIKNRVYELRISIVNFFVSEQTLSSECKLRKCIVIYMKRRATSETFHSLKRLKLELVNCDMRPESSRDSSLEDAAGALLGLGRVDQNRGENVDQHNKCTTTRPSPNNDNMDADPANFMASLKNIMEQKRCPFCKELYSTNNSSQPQCNMACFLICHTI